MRGPGLMLSETPGGSEGRSPLTNDPSRRMADALPSKNWFFDGVTL